MSHSKLTPILYLLAFSLLQKIQGLENMYIFHYCLSSDNFTFNDPYHTNLQQLNSYLAYETPFTGFSLGSKGQGSNQTYGLALCTIGVSMKDCKACIAEATTQTTARCPNEKSAILWLENCMSRYSNQAFFGKSDDQMRFYVVNNNDVVKDPPSFNRKTAELLSQLANNAYWAQRMVAKGDLDLGGSKKVYGSAQCSRDLSSYDCKKCLVESISELPNCCAWKKGGRIIGASCSVRYEVYQFYNATKLVNTSLVAKLLN